MLLYYDSGSPESENRLQKKKLTLITYIFVTDIFVHYKMRSNAFLNTTTYKIMLV